MNNDKLYSLYKDFSQSELDGALMTACWIGEFDKVKYLLASPDLKMHANVDVSYGTALRYACEQNHVDIAEYLLTSPELDKKADYRLDNYRAVNSALLWGSLDIVKFFFSSPKFKDKIDIHHENDIFFESATVENDEKQIRILQYLIFELKIERTRHIDKIINNDLKIQEFGNIIHNMFDIREFNNKLEKEVSAGKVSKIDSKTRKI